MRDNDGDAAGPPGPAPERSTPERSGGPAKRSRVGAPRAIDSCALAPTAHGDLASFVELLLCVPEPAQAAPGEHGGRSPGNVAGGDARNSGAAVGCRLSLVAAGGAGCGLALTWGAADGGPEAPVGRDVTAIARRQARVHARRSWRRGVPTSTRESPPPLPA